MNKAQLQQEIAELQKQLEEKQKALSTMPDKWKPKGGRHYVDYSGLTCTGDSTAKCAAFGAEYPTRQQAEKAAKAMRAHNRLLAYVAEFEPDWEPDWRSDKSKCFVYFDYTSGLFRTHYDIYARNLGTVYMPEKVAKELAAKLNSGEVEL